MAAGGEVLGLEASTEARLESTVDAPGGATLDTKEDLESTGASIVATIPMSQLDVSLALAPAAAVGATTVMISLAPTEVAGAVVESLLVTHAVGLVSAGAVDDASLAAESARASSLILQFGFPVAVGVTPPNCSQQMRMYDCLPPTIQRQKAWLWWKNRYQPLGGSKDHRW